MSYFDFIYERLFEGKPRASRVDHDEVIKRSENYLDRLSQWQASEASQDFLNELWESYYWRKRGIDKDPPVVLFEASNSNGLAINYMQQYDRHYFRYLLDHLAERVKKLGYRQVTSRNSLRDKGDYVEKTEMYYLKPTHDFSPPIDQKFGNVQVEYIERDNEPLRVKLMANSYPDRKYQEVLPFETLAEHVFKVKLK